MQNNIDEIVYYNSVNNYLKTVYGHKLYKIPINGGFTCPNRDGKLDTRGCIFCSNYGSGDFIQGKNKSITEQIDLGIKYIQSKFPDNNGDNKYIAYFQSFTNTYGPIEELRIKYFEALNNDKIEIISIATRPDCLDDEVVDLLQEINTIKPVWIELGLQTIKESSVKYIRRCYENDVYKSAVKRLYDIGISQIITHIIIGLPNEDENDILNTVKYIKDIIAHNNFTENRFGFKFQLLHVLNNTDLAKDYYNKTFDVLSLDEYISILKKCILVMPQNSIVHRLTGDGDKKILIAPLWSGNKKYVINEISKTIKAK